MAITWTSEAKAKLKRVPFFVRPLVKKRAEREANVRGTDKVTAQLLDELRKKEGQ